jgi:hypothetical protein
VRTRMPGGVGGARSGFLTAPIPMGQKKRPSSGCGPPNRERSPAGQGRMALIRLGAMLLRYQLGEARSKRMAIRLVQGWVSEQSASAELFVS